MPPAWQARREDSREVRWAAQWRCVWAQRGRLRSPPGPLPPAQALLPHGAPMAHRRGHGCKGHSSSRAHLLRARPRSALAFLPPDGPPWPGTTHFSPFCPGGSPARDWRPRDRKPGLGSPGPGSWRAGRLCGCPGAPQDWLCCGHGIWDLWAWGQCPAGWLRAPTASLTRGHSGHQWAAPRHGSWSRADWVAGHSCVRTGTGCPRSRAGCGAGRPWAQRGVRRWPRPRAPHSPPAGGLLRPRGSASPGLLSRSHLGGLTVPPWGFLCMCTPPLQPLHPWGSTPPCIQMTFDLPNHPDPPHSRHAHLPCACPWPLTAQISALWEPPFRDVTPSCGFLTPDLGPVRASEAPKPSELQEVPTHRPRAVGVCRPMCLVTAQWQGQPRGLSDLRNGPGEGPSLRWPLGCSTGWVPPGWEGLCGGLSAGLLW